MASAPHIIGLSTVSRLSRRVKSILALNLGANGDIHTPEHKQSGYASDRVMTILRGRVRTTQSRRCMLHAEQRDIVRRHDRIPRLVCTSKKPDSSCIVPPVIAPL